MNADVFFARADQAEGESACWIWGGSKSKSGYGMCSIGGRAVGAHRAAYELVVGPIPDGLVIDHLCRNRACVNPKHLEVVTNAENIRRGHVSRSVFVSNCTKKHRLPPQPQRALCTKCRLTNGDILAFLKSHLAVLTVSKQMGYSKEVLSRILTSDPKGTPSDKFVQRILTAFDAVTNGAPSA